MTRKISWFASYPPHPFVSKILETGGKNSGFLLSLFPGYPTPSLQIVLKCSTGKVCGEQLIFCLKVWFFLSNKDSDNQLTNVLSVVQQIRRENSIIASNESLKRACVHVKCFMFAENTVITRSDQPDDSRVTSDRLPVVFNCIARGENVVALFSPRIQQTRELCHLEVSDPNYFTFRVVHRNVHIIQTRRDVAGFR